MASSAGKQLCLVVGNPRGFTRCQHNTQAARDVANCDAKYNNWVTVAIVKIMKFKADISLENTGF